MEKHGTVENQIILPPTHKHTLTHIHTEQAGTSHSNNLHRLVFRGACLGAVGVWDVCMECMLKKNMVIVQTDEDLMYFGNTN